MSTFEGYREKDSCRQVGLQQWPGLHRSGFHHNNELICTEAGKNNCRPPFRISNNLSYYYGTDFVLFLGLLLWNFIGRISGGSLAEVLRQGPAAVARLVAHRELQAFQQVEVPDGRGDGL